MKKILLTLCAMCCVATLTHAQKRGWDEVRWQRIISEAVPAEARMSAHLYQLAILAAEDRAEAVERLAGSGLRTDPANTARVNVEIVLRPNENTERITDRIEPAYLRGLGLEVGTHWRNRASVWMDIAEVWEKTRRLSPDYFTFLVTVPRGDDQGPSVMNSNTYTSGGAPGGSGVRIAIFDGGYERLQNAINLGKAPTPAYVSLSGAPSTIAAVNFNNAEHGTACLETAFDNAPSSTYEIYANGNTTEKGAAVDTCIAHGVKIISMSQSEYNLGWFDNSGAGCAYALDAAAAGLLFFTSCGNRAESHYEGVFSDADGDSLHAFSGVDERNNILGTVDSNGTHAYLSWDPTTGTDLDIFIRRTSDNSLLASSALTGTGAAGYETVVWSNPSPNNVAVYFEVKRKSGPATTFEMFTHNAGNYEWATAAGSNTSPSNTTLSNVISVGAVGWWNHSDSSGATGIVESYSSRGPTNSGWLAPKICAPTGTNTYVYGGGFGGTSCSTPNAAGAAAALWSANPGLDATGVQQILIRKAELYKDFGIAGADNIYGNGGLFLFPWATNLRYMLRSPVNGTAATNTRPFPTLLAAEQLAPAGSTVIILNSGNYPETGLFGTVLAGNGKSILYRSPFKGVNANFGF